MEQQSKTDTRAYIFDYGGTLDTAGQHWGMAIWHTYEEAGVPVSEADYREAYVHTERTLGREPIIGSDFTFRQTLDVKLRMQMERLQCSSYHDRVLNLIYARTKAQTQHSLQVLRQLKARCELVLVSNFYGNLTTVLQEFGFDGLFAHVVESAAVGVRKPDPRIFSMAVDALQMPPAEVTVVGDSIGNDILPAREAGCQTVWLRGEPWTVSQQDETAPNRIITDLSELLD